MQTTRYFKIWFFWSPKNHTACMRGALFSMTDGCNCSARKDTQSMHAQHHSLKNSNTNRLNSSENFWWMLCLPSSSCLKVLNKSKQRVWVANKKHTVQFESKSWNLSHLSKQFGKFTVCLEIKILNKLGNNDINPSPKTFSPNLPRHVPIHQTSSKLPWTYHP